jgi:UDP-2,4-diacetamido-2,4,6-trideoxy-beta-L-altropyranose hydrolase
MTRIAFRLDATADIGLGHASRCLTLADELVARGAEVFIVGRGIGAFTPAHPHLRLLELSDHAAAARDDAAAFLGALGQGPFDWIVVDHYRLGRSWELEVRAHARRLLVIDDLADREHECDLLLDQNLRTGGAASYAKLVPAGATVLVGPRYALLRPSFARLRAERKLRGSDGVVQRLLVCFGGSDPKNHTSACIEALRPWSGELAIQVVIGAANQNQVAVAESCHSIGLREPLRDPPDLSSLMSASDLIVGAGGTMTWERACLGVPTIAVGIAANQEMVLEHMLDSGALLGIPSMPEPDMPALRALIGVALKSPKLLAGMARRAAAMVDGEGSKRVADVMCPVPVVFRRATSSDSDSLFAWRNDPTVRAVSHDSREIALDDHRRWLESTMADPARVLLIAEVGGVAVGVVRFDIDQDRATISVYRVPGAPSARIGLVRSAVDWLRTHRKDVVSVIAGVKSGNEASLRAFSAAGFEEMSRELKLEIDR